MTVLTGALLPPAQGDVCIFTFAQVLSIQASCWQCAHLCSVLDFQHFIISSALGLK